MKPFRLVVGAALAVLAMLSATVGSAGAITDTDPSDNSTPLIASGAVPDWVVRLDIDLGGSSAARCSGSLVDTEFVVTSAHCVAVDADFFRGFVRESQISAYVGESQVRREIRDITVHSTFTLDNRPRQNDIAVLRLDRPVSSVTETLRIGELPGVATSYVVSQFGFGLHQADDPDTAADESRIDNRARVAVRRTSPLNRTGVCAGLLCSDSAATSGAASCGGDSGGPVVRNGNTLVGVHSSSLFTEGGCGSSFAVNFAVVAATHTNFVKQTIANAVCTATTVVSGSHVRMVGWGEGATSSSDVIVGTHNSETLSGGGGNDVICGRGGNDTIYGNSGNDRLEGGEGVDTIFGGTGNDAVRGDNGVDWLYGDSGDDIIQGGELGDRMYGGSGEDRLYGQAGGDYLYGGDHNDILRGQAGRDRLYGQNGADDLHGNDGHDYLDGGWGNDDLFGGNHVDELRGSAGADKLYGGNGSDMIYGGNGNDQLFGQNGHFDELYGGAGSDTNNGGAGTRDLCTSGSRTGCER